MKYNPGYIQNVYNNQNHPSMRAHTTKNDGVFLRLARIVNVDYENFTVDLVYLTMSGAEPKVPVTSGYAGYRSFIGGMPQIGDWVIVGYSMSGNFRIPYIGQFLPKGYRAGVLSDIIGVPKSLERDGSGKSDRFKMQKLYDGEIYACSTYGSEFYLDKNVSISNSKLNEIFLKASDQSMHFNALNLAMNSAGVRMQSGLIYRNELIDDPEFIKIGGGSQFPIYYNEDGIACYVPNISNNINADFPYGRETIDDSNKGFVEHRIEIKEAVHPILDVNISNSGADIDSFYSRTLDGKSEQPLVVQVLGTLIGNDPAGTAGRSKYGTILRPTIFPNKNTWLGKLQEVPCINDNGTNEISSLAAAYTLKLPNTGTAFYINKQGKMFANISSSSAVDPIGAGESVELNTAGHVRSFLGKNATDQRSLSLGTAGGVYTNWGFDNIKSRSWDATFKKGVSWNILGRDKDGVSLLMDIQGDERREINGTRYTVVKGDDIRLVYGILEDRVFGKKLDNFINDKATTYGGNFDETIMGKYTSVIASGRQTEILAPNIAAGETNADNTIITAGDSSLTMLLGSKNEDIVVGNYNTTIGAGNKSISIVAGNYSVDISAGNISIKTLAGSVEVGTTAGTCEISGTLGVKIKSAVKVEVDAPQVKIGKLSQAGIVTEMMPCFFSGAPHQGSKTVTCNSL